jgi:tyrosyl-tRNA synthetase
LNAADEDAGGFLRIFSLKNRKEIEDLEKEHQQAPHLRILQKALAEEVTDRVHGQDALDKAIRSSQILFGKATEEMLRELNTEELLDIFEGVPQFEVQRSSLSEGLPIIELLAERTQIFTSKGEARKMLQANGVALNKVKAAPDRTVAPSDLLNERLLLVQKGKKNYFLITFN